MRWWKSKNQIIIELEAENKKLNKEISTLVNGIMEYREALGLNPEDGKPKELKQLEPQLFKNNNINHIILDKAISNLKDSPDFELFLNLLHDEEEFCYIKLCEEEKERHDYWKGRIYSYRKLINQISHEIKILADNERKKT